MAKSKNKAASKKASAKVEKAVMEAAKDGKVTKEEVAAIEKAKKEAKKVKTAMVKDPVGAKGPKGSKHAFPKEDCKHTETKKVRNHRNRIETICIDCGKRV